MAGPWYLDGKNHPMDGLPLVFCGYAEEWWVDGRRHRDDGSAVILPNGDEFWYWRDVHVTEEVLKWISEAGMLADWCEWGEQHCEMFRSWAHTLPEPDAFHTSMYDRVFWPKREKSTEGSGNGLIAVAV
jgi:hypothetical protein